MSSKAVLNNNFRDDEEIVAKKDASGDKPASFLVGTAKATIINKTEAPLEETRFNVLLELTGSGLSVDRIGVDIVAVLDVSGSMGGDQRLAKLQRAMKFVIRKLSPIDRLSIVSFNHKANRLCPLRQVTEDCQPQIEKIVNDLVARGSTDIVAGVFTALEVVNARRYTEGRKAAIMVMSDGEADYDDISTLEMKDVPVFTFGFSEAQDSKVLNNIAKGSKGGTYSDVQNTDTLGLAFSQCLAGLLTLVVEDLTLTVTPLSEPELKPTVIEDIHTGYYPRPKDLNTVEGSITVSFGDLYDQEVRKVLLQLLLPKATVRIGMDVLRVSLTYKYVSQRTSFIPSIAAGEGASGTTDLRPRAIVVAKKSGGFELEPSDFILAISKKGYKSRMSDCWAHWDDIPVHVKNAIWADLMAAVAVDEFDIPVFRNHWDKKMRKNYRCTISAAKKKQKKPDWMSADVWAGFKQLWDTPATKEISARNSANRNKNPVIHRGGSKPFQEYRKELAKNQRREPTYVEVIRRTHAVEHTDEDGSVSYTWVDNKSSKIMEKYEVEEARVLQSTGRNELTVQEQDRIFDAVSDPPTRNRRYGFGNQEAVFTFSNINCHFIPSQVPKSPGRRRRR